MKILHVGVGNLGSGGVATYVGNVVAGLTAQGHEIHLAELWPGETSLTGVQTRIHGLPELWALQRSLLPDVTHLHSQLPSYDGLQSPVVLTAHEHSAHCPSGGRYLEARRKPCDRPFGNLSCLWGHYVDRCGSRAPSSIRTRFGVTSATLHYPGRWIAPSSYCQEKLILRGIPADRVDLISNPGGELGPEPDPARKTIPLVLFVGRLVPNKGCDVLIRALAELPPETRLEILGDGPEKSRLESLSKSLQLGDRVRFLGWCSADVVAQRMATARAVAVPSLWPEPFGLVALEAGKFGCPVVASAVGGLKDLVEEGVNGTLVYPDNAPALAAALAPYLGDGTLARIVGFSARNLIKTHHNMDLHLDLLLASYRKSQAGAA